MSKKRKKEPLTVLERVAEYLEYHRAIDKHKSQVAFFEILYDHLDSVEKELKKLKEVNNGV